MTFNFTLDVVFPESNGALADLAKGASAESTICRKNHEDYVIAPDEKIAQASLVPF
ncbi:MAG: hypothetical protein ABSD13_14715 [Candidatus Korobacteraceae bacterium]|jgi:hypothetical protein